MSSTRKKRSVQVGQLLGAAIKSGGVSLPANEEEIAAAENAIEREAAIVPPDRLQVPPDFSSPSEMRFRPRGHPLVDVSAAAEMARAAREGGAIPREVEERMAKDRAAASQRKDDDDDRKE